MKNLLVFLVAFSAITNLAQACNDADRASLATLAGKFTKGDAITQDYKEYVLDEAGNSIKDEKGYYVLKTLTRQIQNGIALTPNLEKCQLEVQQGYVTNDGAFNKYAGDPKVFIIGLDSYKRSEQWTTGEPAMRIDTIATVVDSKINITVKKHEAALIGYHKKPDRTSTESFRIEGNQLIHQADGSDRLKVDETYNLLSN